MKKLYITLATLFIALVSIGQTSVQDGNWMNPLTWDCTCVPNPYFTAIDVTIDHTVTVDINGGGLYFEGGTLTIGANGTLLQSGDGDLLVHNGVTLVNGILDMRRVAIHGGTGTYNGVIQNCDSLWNDSSTVVNNGTITCYDHQVFGAGEMTNNGTIRMTHEMNIQGEYINSASGVIYIDGDFSNANTFGGRALYTNNGDHQVGNNFINTVNDTITGTGTICIGNLSTNQGKVLGSLTVSTPSGGFSVNTGVVGSSVSFNTSSCSLGSIENQLNMIELYPNPFLDFIKIEGVKENMTIELFDLNGRYLQLLVPNQGAINLSGLENGVYLVKINTMDGSACRKIIKQ